MWLSIGIEIVLAIVGVYSLYKDGDIDNKFLGCLYILLSAMGIHTIIILYFLGVYQ